jgi:hypothetical protein
MVNGFVIGISILHVVFIVWATVIGSRNGRTWLGFFLGLILSWIGVIIMYLIGPKNTYAAR